MSRVTLAAIQHFLSARCIAFLGPSRNEQEYSRLLFREFVRHGYEVFPVHPLARELDGRACFASIGEIHPTPERALILLPEDLMEQAVLDCANAGVRDIWLHRLASGATSDSPAARRAEERGLNLISGYCPFLFLPKAGGFHRFHGRCLKFFGLYPR